MNSNLKIYCEKIGIDRETGRRWVTFNGSQSYALDKWTLEEARKDFVSYENYVSTFNDTYRAWAD